MFVPFTQEIFISTCNESGSHGVQVTMGEGDNDD